MAISDTNKPLALSERDGALVYSFLLLYISINFHTELADQQ